MKFVSVKTVRGLIPGQEVFTLNEHGEYGVGKLLSRTEDAKGLHLRFEVPQYFNEKMPMIKQAIVENITHVSLQRNKKQEVVNNGVEIALTELAK